MLTKISAALAKFINPVRPSPSSPGTDSHSSASFARYEPGPEKHEKEERKENSEPEQQAQPEAKPGTASTNHPLLHLFAFLEGTRKNVERERGHDSYRSALKKQKKAARFRKGVVIDRKAS